MANHDLNIDAAQSFISRDIPQDVKISDGVEGVSNTAVDPKKSRAALLSGLDALMGAVEQGGNATNGSASDANKGKNVGSPPSSDPQDLTDATGDDNPSMMPVGMAMLKASQKLQNSSNEIIKNLADISTEIMDVTTSAAKAGTELLKNYYDYGLSTAESNSADGIGQWSIGKSLPAGDIQIDMKIKDGHYLMSVDGGKIYKDIGVIQTITGTAGFVEQPPQSAIDAVFPGFKWKTDNATVQANRYQTYWHSGSGSKGDGEVFQMTISAPARTTGGTGIAGSTAGDMQDKLSQYTYLQDENNQTNTALQNLSALPTALENTIVGAIDKDHDSDASTLSAIASFGNLIKGWRN